MAEGHPEKDRGAKADQPQTPPSSPPVLDYYHAPRRPSRVMKWLRWLPRPSWVTVVAMLLTGAAGYWLSTDSAAWVVTRRFEGHLLFHSINRAVSADGKRLLTVLNDRRTIRVLDIATGKAVIDLTLPAGTADRAEFSPDGSRVWSLGTDNREMLWDVSTGQVLASLHVVRESDDPRAFSADGKWLAAPDDQVLRLCDGHSGAVLAELPVSTAATNPVFSPDSRYLAVGGDLVVRVRLWDLQTWQDNAVTGPEPREIAFGGVKRDGDFDGFQPDGTLVMQYKDHIDLRGVATNQLYRSLCVPERLWGRCGLSPDGRYLLGFGDDREFETWDAATQKRIGALPELMPLAAISPDGTRIGECGAVWSFPSLRSLAEFGAGNDPHFGWFAWLPGGRAFVNEPVSMQMYPSPSQIELFQLRRPEAVYGLLWLPQCWLALIGAVAAVWLVYRDIRRWRRNPPAL